MKLCFISDTHDNRVTINPVDVVVHCGDATDRTSIHEFATWFGELPATHKILVAGNHDFQLENNRDWKTLLARDYGVTYLMDSGVVIDGVSFWGSPWTPEFFDWAFMLPRGQLHTKWDLIPVQTDVLITHGPPHGILDETRQGDSAGCAELLDAVKRVQPRIHAFGHIHEGAGVAMQPDIDTLFINAAQLDHRYRLVNTPQYVDLFNKKPILKGVQHGDV